jgi:hypothetical protein
MSFYHKSNINVYISKAAEGSANAGNTVLLNVKNFSFNQMSNMEVVSRETLDSNQERTVDPYLSTISPVNFSFTTYMLPMKSGNVVCPDEYLWVSLLGADSLTSISTSLTIDFSDGNVATLQELTIWFDYSGQAEGNYRIDNVIVDSVTISFDVNNIAMLEWKGRGLNLVEANTPPSATDRTGQTGYLKNKLSTLSVTSGAAFTMALTGGSVEIENNNQFYNTQRLGEVSKPVGHYTGNRTINGDLQVYMRSGTNRSVDLFNQILNNADSATYESNYLSSITINIGGTSPDPFVQLNFPQVLFNIPEQNFDDVITLKLPFKAKEEAGNYCTVIYNIP